MPVTRSQTKDILSGTPVTVATTRQIKRAKTYSEKHTATDTATGRLDPVKETIVIDKDKQLYPKQLFVSGLDNTSSRAHSNGTNREHIGHTAIVESERAVKEQTEPLATDRQSNGNQNSENKRILNLLTMDIFWFVRITVCLMSAIWIPGGVIYIYTNQGITSNGHIEHVRQISENFPSDRHVSPGTEPVNKVKPSMQLDICFQRDPFVQKKIKGVNGVLETVQNLKHETDSATSTASLDVLNQLKIRYEEVERANTIASNDMQATKVSLEDLMTKTIRLSALQMSQNKSIQDLLTEMDANNEDMTTDIHRNHDVLMNTIDRIDGLTKALDGTQYYSDVATGRYPNDVRSNLMAVAYCSIICSIFVCLITYAIKVIITAPTQPKGRNRTVETVNPGTDYVIFTFTRHTEGFLKTLQCTMMTQLKQLPCFDGTLVQEIYIPDDPELGPLKTSLANVQGCICVYEYNDRDTILELPTDLETKKRDTLAMIRKESDSSDLKLLAVYIFDPRSAKLWDGEIYNSLIGQTYEDDMLRGVANAGQLISINKEFIKPQLDQIQTILQ
ncbi:unnamed protein product [Owenia fusiformis]|uniref:Uncharacterized protein n=1 Tax=Owenia fusiformis TaxID=6347 RepID=A0A8J1TDA5_OWEFU|nr:unnamed protein product [Owenia fusiformis]